jgi:hypothetical protein
LLDKVERLWPERLNAIADARRKEKQEGTKAVHQYVLKASDEHR